MQGPFLRKYGVEATIDFQLFETDGVDFKVDAAHATADTKIMKDEGAEANTSNAFTDEGQGYSIVLTATEMQMARGVIYVVDQSTKVWLDTRIIVETYGHASAMHAFDLDSAIADANVQEWLGTTVPIPTVAGRPVVSMGYEGGKVFVDTVNGAAGTVSHVNGTAENPSNSIANAKTIADALNMKIFRVLPGSSITLAANYDDYIFDACHAIIALGGQSVNNTVFIGAVITGNDDGTNGTHAQYFDCVFASSTLGQFVFTRCYITGTITLAQAGTYFMHQCFSGVSGLGTPVLDFGAALAVSDVSMRDYSGGIHIHNMGNIGADTLSLEGFGQLIINANCNPANSPVIAIRGLFSPLTDNVAGGFVAGGGTLSQDARYDTGQITASVPTAVENRQEMDSNSTELASLITGVPQMKYNGPHGPGVYIDSGAGNTNTVEGTDGTFDNPVSTFVAAKTIADALGTNGVKTYYIIGNSDLTLAAAHLDWTFVGLGSTISNIINLGSQDVGRSTFINVTLEGTQGGSARIIAVGCGLQDPGAGDTTLHIAAVRCGIVDRIQVDTSNDNVFDQCFSLVPGTAAPVIQATGAAGTIAVRHYSGGIEFESLSASHNLSVEADGQVIFNADCNVNATVALRGMMTITDNTAGMNNLSTRAVFEEILDDGVTLYDRSTASLAKLVRSTTPANTLDVDADGEVDLNMAQTTPGSPTADTVGEALRKAHQQLPEAPQKNAALNDLPFLMVDETDFATPETGLTVTGQVSKDSGAFAGVVGSIAEIGNGVYTIDATAADMNADLLIFRFSSAGAADTFITIKTTPEP